MKVQAALIAAALTAVATPSSSEAQKRNFRASSDAYHSENGAGVRTVVEGLGPDWEIESRTTAVNRRTGQRITVSGSASARGTSSSVNETQKEMVWFQVPIYYKNSNGTFMGSGPTSWYVAGFKRELVEEGSAPYYMRTSHYRPTSYSVFSAAPGTVYASAQNESGVTRGAPRRARGPGLFGGPGLFRRR